ncbi:DNA polymerase Y family protein [Edaphobacter bradus]|uniref:DNA polymerase Y family protein n=1 Tax=Edaphobacter bradus TaxID=2259016 RepID=UPI0021E08EA4|nr:DNA polymerase Y family protein [Edaphobacter bradus]
MTNPAELYACLYAKEFPAQALLRLRPQLQDKPCVVTEGEPPLQQVCSLNTRARLLGIRYGMTQVEVDTFPASVVLSRSNKTEASAKSILLECAGAFSPRVEGRSEDAAFLCGIDIAGTGSLFGQPEMLARSLLQRVRAVGMSARVTVSHNFHTAICLARGLSPRIPIKVIASGEEASALSSLPLAVLDLTETQEETFALWGIHNLGMLAALPEKELIARMGQDGKRFRQLARGELPHLFQPIEPPFTLDERLELDSPVELLDSLMFVIGVMLDQLILRARVRILALATITVALTLDGRETHTRTVRPALPSNDKQLWIKLLHLDLEAHPPQASILAVALHAEPGSTSKVQLGLFSPQLPEAARLDVTLARIRAIVGEDNVGRAVLQDTHATDGFRMELFTVPSGDSALVASPQPRASMRQLRPPETASVTLRNSRPAMFFFRERRYAVEHAYGPWLVEGDWWNQPLWGFEQWDLVARSQDGGMLCCCMMRDLMRNQWQMAAFYD